MAFVVNGSHFFIEKNTAVYFPTSSALFLWRISSLQHYYFLRGIADADNVDTGLHIGDFYIIAYGSIGPSKRSGAYQGALHIIHKNICQITISSGGRYNMDNAFVSTHLYTLLSEGRQTAADRFNLYQSRMSILYIDTFWCFCGIILAVFRVCNLRAQKG